ncbi:helix-turn-helix domain-containing protein [Chryseobacterium sp. S-02]|uniref:helix-turn-helix domain-containing protein n=1 Tax=Chryseobacterium sp. S-02 TaxID=3404064 RepID=UPI003CED7AAB
MQNDSIVKSSTSRNTEITQQYFNFLDRHIDDVVNGRVSEFLEINQVASELAVSHKHLTDTVQKEVGNHPCHFYDLKIIEVAKKMLINTDLSIAEIARKLTYDPSNFSKFFKNWVLGKTPGQFRKEHKK